jgi:hypothetical protein
MFCGNFRSAPMAVLETTCWVNTLPLQVVSMLSTNLRASHFAVRAATLAFIVAIAAPTTSSSGEPPSEIDGLVRVDSRGLDHVFVLPGADFASYKRVRLDPVEVSFSERWDPNSNRTRSRSTQRSMTDQDVETLRSNVATEFQEILKNELRSGGYALVQGNGADVLGVTPMIVNLYVTAPSAQQRPGSRTFIANTGHMTLVAEVSDSVTGEPLARVIDTRQGRQNSTLQLSSSVTNMADARRAFTDWARLLRTGLDEARASPVGKENLQQAAKETEAQPR